jgi:hypothetical protein
MVLNTTKWHEKRRASDYITSENHANVVFSVRVKVVGMAWTPHKAQQIHGIQTTL